MHRGLILVVLIVMAGRASAQTQSPPVSPYVTPSYGTDPAHRHKAYAVTKYGISCAGDRVVWVDTNSGVYHLDGERWFGRTRSGQYECEKAARAEGDRETRNGQ